MTTKKETRLGIGMSLLASLMLFSTLANATTDDDFESFDNDQEYLLAIQDVNGNTVGDELKKVKRQDGLYELYIEESKEAKLKKILLLAPAKLEEVKVTYDQTLATLKHSHNVVDKLMSKDKKYEACRLLLYSVSTLKEDKEEAKNLYETRELTKSEYQKVDRAIALKLKDKTLSSQIKQCKKTYGSEL